MIKKNVFVSILLLVVSTCFAQLVTISGVATDSSNGAFPIEIIVNDTLAKVAKSENGRTKYLKIYQDPDYVVRTDSTGTFSIRAKPTDYLYFKSYHHFEEKHLVSDLIKQKKICIRLKHDPNEPQD